MSSPLTSLMQAIYAKCLATGAITTAFPGFTDGTSVYPVGYYRDLAPERAPLPYVVSTVIAAPATSKYGGVQRTEPLIQFTAYAVGDSDSGIQAFVGAFDELTLTLSAGHVINVTRVGDPLPILDSEKDASGNDVWGYMVQYNYSLSLA